MHFVRLIFFHRLNKNSQSLTGDFSKNVQRRCFHGALGDVANRRLVGLPQDPIYFVRLIFPEI